MMTCQPTPKTMRRPSSIPNPQEDPLICPKNNNTKPCKQNTGTPKYVQILADSKRNTFTSSLSENRSVHRLKLHLAEWKDRLAPKSDQILSVRYTVPSADIEELGLSKQKGNTPILSTMDAEHQNQSRNSNTFDLGQKNRFENQIVVKQICVKKQQKNIMQTKFRVSSNSHRRRQKQFQQKLLEYVHQQRFFYDNAKYRYQSQQSIQKLMQLSDLCSRNEDYVTQTANVRDHIVYHRKIDANQYERVVGEKISRLFRRTTNFGNNFF